MKTTETTAPPAIFPAQQVETPKGNDGKKYRNTFFSHCRSLIPEIKLIIIMIFSFGWKTHQKTNTHNVTNSRWWKCSHTRSKYIHVRWKFRILLRSVDESLLRCDVTIFLQQRDGSVSLLGSAELDVCESAGKWYERISSLGDSEHVTGEWEWECLSNYFLLYHFKQPPPPPEEEKKQKEQPQDKVKVAKKIAKEMEKWVLL